MRIIVKGTKNIFKYFFIEWLLPPENLEPRSANHISTVLTARQRLQYRKPRWHGLYSTRHQPFSTWGYNGHNWYNEFNWYNSCIVCRHCRVWHIHVPYHPEVLRAHRNHFCLRVRRGDRGFQIDERETRTETSRTCQAEQREFHTCPSCQRFPAWFCGNQGHRIPHAGPLRPPTCARCDDVPDVYCIAIIRII